MHQQRKLPSKRYSSYVPPTELAVFADTGPPISDIDAKNNNINLRSSSVSTPDKIIRRKNCNTLHFDALQSAVSKLSRIDDFDLEALGSGYFSDVFKVTHKQSRNVMVLKRNRNTNTKLNILREIQLMNRLSHPNILKFMGVCVHEGQLHALTEYINGGDLDQLVQQKNTPLSWVVRIRLALDISKGVAYLHSMEIFHRDLTSKNCLVKMTLDSKHKKRYSALVADLGLAEKIPTKPEEQARLRVVGTPYCMAPEVLRDKPYDERSDIFSFGLIICQLIVRTSFDPEKLPRANDFGLQHDHFEILVKQGAGSPEATTGTSPVSKPPISFLQLGYQCCEIDPSKRPAFKEIVCRLEESINEEKLRRTEKKKLFVKIGEASKRHSSVLSELPSVTSVSEKSTKQLMKKERTASDSNKENDYSNGTLQLKQPPISSVFQPRRSSAGSLSSRLSRSSSDVSSEFISHAASIIAMAQNKSKGHDQTDDISSMVSSLNEAFINPFSTLENEELQEPKLVDLPSSEVLEMAFDLPKPGLLLGNLRPNRKSQRRHNSTARPKSLLLQMPFQNSSSPLSKPLTPDPHNDTRIPQLFGNEIQVLGDPLSCPPSPQPTLLSPRLSNLAQEPLVCKSRLKHALIRSMALSPQGCRLLSWWRNHGRAANWRSLTSVLSLMTEKLGTLRRSISIPDLSQDVTALLALSDSASVSGGSSRSSVTSEKGSPRSSLSSKPPSGVGLHPHIYPAYATLPRKRKTRRHSAAATDQSRKRRSKTSDDVFHDLASLEILHEETTEAAKQNTTCHANSTSNISEIHKDDTGCTQQEINNNTKTVEKLTLNPNTLKQNVPCVCGSPTEIDALSARLEETRLENPTDGAVSSSSSSSGTSITALNMTLQSGMVCSNRRRRIGIMSPSSSRNSIHFEETAPNLVDSRGDQTPRSNRDSGYNEDIVFSSENSCDSQSSHDTVDSGLRSRSSSGKSVHFRTPLCPPSNSKSTSSKPKLVREFSDDYIGEVAPCCKVRDSNDNKISLIGKSH